MLSITGPELQPGHVLQKLAYREFAAGAMSGPDEAGCADFIERTYGGKR